MTDETTQTEQPEAAPAPSQAKRGPKAGRQQAPGNSAPAGPPGTLGVFLRLEDWERVLVQIAEGSIRSHGPLFEAVRNQLQAQMQPVQQAPADA